jgi:hypothetical protein
MKNFVKENWYKLMVGSSMLMASFGFMMYAISPAYSNNNENKVEIPSNQNTTSPVGTNGVLINGYVYFVDGGYAYICEQNEIKEFFGFSTGSKKWSGSQYGYIRDDGTGTMFGIAGKKIKLP